MDAETAAYWFGWLRVVQLIAVFLVAVGVVAEFASEWLGRPLERIIDTARELKIAELNNETAQLEKIVAGRQLSAEQIASISESLKGFVGRRIYISSYNGDAEGTRLALQLKKAIEDAGIVVADNEIGRAIVGRGMHGSTDLKFGIDIQALDSEKDFADAIAAALAEYGKLKIEAISSPNLISPPHPTLGIRVGLRPL